MEPTQRADPAQADKALALPPDGSVSAGMLAHWARQESRHCLIFLDTRGYVTGLTAAAELLLGYRSDELIGKSFSQIFSQRDQRMKLDRHELDVAARIGYSEDDRWHRRRDNSLVWVSGVVTRITDAAGIHIGFVKVMADRTDTRTQVEALQNQVRGHDEQARARFDALADELESIVWATSDVLRTLKGAAPDARGKLEASVAAQMQALGRLANTLRDAGGPARTAPAVRIEAVVVQTVLGDAIGACRSRAGSAGVSLELIAPPVAIRIDADRERVFQIVMNLLDNAIRFTPRGGSAWVKATVEGDMAVIRVEDTGIGIEGATLRRIFDLFTHDRSWLATGGGKAGGLGAVNEFARLLGGTVDVRSDGHGHGCGFAVRLPLRQNESARTDLLNEVEAHGRVATSGPG